VVDTSTPTRVFDEVDLFEQNGRVVQTNANLFLRSMVAYRGRYALEVEATGDGPGDVIWHPVRLDSHETNYFHFAFKKINPESKMLIGWSDGDGLKYVATDGDLGDNQGWKVHDYKDTDWHEIVVSYATMATGSIGKSVPRGKVKTFWFGIRNAKRGD